MTTTEPTPKQIADSNVKDALRWVAQCAKAAIMLGNTGPGHEEVRKALAQLDKAYLDPRLDS